MRAAENFTRGSTALTTGSQSHSRMEPEYSLRALSLMLPHMGIWIMRAVSLNPSEQSWFRISVTIH